MNNTNQNLEMVYPYKILSEFVKKATKHYEKNAQKELMACVIGYKKGDKLIGEELLFPKQSCPHTNNTDLGKEYLGNLVHYIYSSPSFNMFFYNVISYNVKIFAVSVRLL